MVSLIVMVMVWPGAKAVTVPVGCAVSFGSACPQGALFCGPPWPFCMAHDGGACRLKCARAGFARKLVDTPSNPAMNQARTGSEIRESLLGIRTSTSRSDHSIAESRGPQAEPVTWAEQCKYS